MARILHDRLVREFRLPGPWKQRAAALLALKSQSLNASGSQSLKTQNRPRREARSVNNSISEMMRFSGQIIGRKRFQYFHQNSIFDQT